MSDDNSVMDTETAKKLVSYIERIEHMDEERISIAEDIKNEFLAAKGAGFDVKIMKAILKLRKRSTDEVEEEEALLDVYKAALNML